MTIYNELYGQTFPVNYPEMVIHKSSGTTPTEKKLVSLGYQTFLHLWSFPNPYKKQDHGKELCDLLVIFGDHIIIFSDKDCKYGSTDNPNLDWSRWYKRAILHSVNQLLGAKLWIEHHPDRICLDSKCEQPFPLRINITDNTKFHLIAVAHGSSEACKNYFSGGDGGLLINTFVVGDMHYSKECTPFTVGLINTDPSLFIHVFDDASYATILQELDTIQDFINYLDSRKTLLLGHKVTATSEKELLAMHLQGLMIGRHDGLTVQLKSNHDLATFLEGGWDSTIESSHYSEWKRKLAISYFWDELLQRTFYYVENGLSFQTSTPSLNSQSNLFYWLAKEDRLHRFALSQAFLSFYDELKPGYRGTRTIYFYDNPDICYVLFFLPQLSTVSNEEYRSTRRNMLIDYCHIAKASLPEVKTVVGIAHETPQAPTSSEDFIYLDTSEEDQKQSLDVKEQYVAKGLLAPQKFYYSTIDPQKWGTRMKGRDRNKPCPCGSGKKYKKCCGRYET